MAKENFYQQNTLPNLCEENSFPMPSKIGPYRIESQLGRGGMSFLYLAAHPQSDEPLVIKVLSPKFITNKEMVERFLKEAQIISMTDHPNIIKLYDQGQWEKGLYIAMEFIQGISLRQFILHKSLSQKRALQIIQEVAYALLHLHTHGVIHRDLKPENILITESGKVKVIDFGIAQLHADISEEKSHAAGKLIGTPVYMSPEQKENPDKVSFVSDIYSLGIIAYELILGRLSHGIIHLSFLPSHLRKIIESTLKVDPKDRYQDVVDVITAINIYLRSLSEEKTKEPYTDAFEGFLKDKETFFHVDVPSWPQLDIGLAKQKGAALTGLYYDFIKILESNYLCIMAEPIDTGVSTFITTAMMKGIIKTSVYQCIEEKKEFHSLTFINRLNYILSTELDFLFQLNVLLLCPDLDRLTFISCGHTPIYHYSERGEKTRILKTPNEAVGSSIHTSFLETADNWNVGDILLIPSLRVHHLQDLSSLFSHHLFLSSQNQAEKIIQDLKDKPTLKIERDSLVISISRIF